MERSVKIVTPIQAAEFFRLFFGATKVKRYVFGINEYADNVAKLVEIDGFIDEFTALTSWQRKPVYKLTNISPDSLVISCVTVSRSITALCKLVSAGVQQYADYFSVAEASDGRLPLVNAIAETREDYQRHANEYEWLRQRLHDEQSRVIFDDLLNFRMTGNLESMQSFEYAADRQYFEPFLALRPGEVFVDGGGFDGFTSREFANRNPDYSAIHLFEPSAKMLSVAKTKLADLSRVTFYPLGLYDQPASLRFDANEGSASRITENGTETIRVDRLDSAVTEPVSFIKMDLEGAEMAALRGAERHILSDHPKLAIAVYHRPSDFWEVPRFVLSLRSDYKLYLRHYTESWTETIMFFLPDKSVSTESSA